MRRAGPDLSRRAALAAGLALPFAFQGAARSAGGGRWELRAPAPWRVQEVYAAARGPEAMIAGGMQVGVDGKSRAIAKVGLYDPTTDRWREGPPLPEPRHHPLLVAHEGQVFAIGGATHESETHEGDGAWGHWRQRRDVFVEQDGAWTPGPSLPIAQSEGVAVVHEGRIHVISGRTSRSADARLWPEQRDVDLHQVLDVASGRWSDAAPIPGARNSATGAVIDGRIYVAGGRTMAGGNMARLDVYDPTADRWEPRAPMPEPAGGLAGAVLDGLLYVFGGERLHEAGPGGVIGLAWRYDPKRDAWERMADMATPRHGLAAVALGAGSWRSAAERSPRRRERPP
ncbi:Kelch repeat-containing protein [Chenggangzhangella methanolivorans]|uniref:Galactose oxidase n=1 Tax=Chenggangzhangella methanolivorans TaxID=1437009 RepID=A0A9E6UKT5_9HYPH|nr:kelch repeat-containing protein [Chenggangzhangella methanolivorans]QZN98260.1 hypothetical protein K6K41_13970 [Chenggangzhangella methanolivorans]